MGNESKIDYTLMNRFGVNQVQSVASTLTQMEDFIEQQKLSPGYDKDIVQLLNIFSVNSCDVSTTNFTNATAKEGPGKGRIYSYTNMYSSFKVVFLIVKAILKL